VRVGIVGGGLMGLAVADRLAAAGHSVTVYERATQPGGLATWQDFGPCTWDRFYHVILPSDAPLIGFLRELGLADQLCWRPTQTGYYVDHKFYGLSNNLEFLRFPPLNLWDKARLAATILYCSRIEDWRRLENITVEDWLIRTSGRATFEKFWRPLLLAKLGENYRRVSAVFIWSYIKRLFSARDAAAQAEQLGYVSGGYRKVFLRIQERVQAAHGALRLNVDVRAVTAGAERGISIAADVGAEQFDKVVFTSPVNVMRAVVQPDLVALPSQRGDIEYLGVVCPVLLTRQAIMPYYVLNIADARIPFTGVVGMSNLVDRSETADLHLNYLPKYVLSDDPILRASDADLKTIFLSGVRAMFPQLAATDIVDLQIQRAVKVQPLQVLNYSQLVQQPTTQHRDFYVLNTAQFVNNTLNNNQVIRTVNEFFAAHGADFAAAPALARAA
jgi:protoporphyrinogen oxidase